MSPSEHKHHSESLRPVHLVLIKVSPQLQRHVGITSNEQLWKITFKIVNSPTKLLPAWHGVLRELKLTMRMMPCDYQKALKAMTGDLDLGLYTYELTAQEWRIAEQLCDILQILKDATLFFSQGMPNLMTVIPAKDHIDQHFASSSLNHKYNAAICTSLVITKKTLNRYYDLTDTSEVYCIAMVGLFQGCALGARMD
ncbi:hypothetical protein K439DRAFT_1648431 [Ramaria rubella]|nr:hypothetical protein K439DRAFT_1648431 [Ramaria rubella]